MGEVLIEGRRLDVFEGFSFSFNYGIADVRNPNKRSTEYSKTIKCPSTPNNDRLFGHIYDVNIANPYDSASLNVEVNFNPNKKASAIVLSDSLTVMTGVVQLRKVTIEKSKYVYEVVFIGKLKNIFSVLGDSQLNDFDDDGNPLIDFSDLDHKLSRNVISDSWSNTDGYVYPMIDYGLSYDFDSTGKRIYDVGKFRPAVFLKNVVDRLFDYAGFTYTSAFLDSTFFSKLIIPWYLESFTLTDDQITERQFVAASGIQQNIITNLTPDTNSANSYTRLEFLDSIDPSNLWNESLFEFSPFAIGYYKFTSNISITVERIGSSTLTGVLPATLVVWRKSGSTTTVIDSVQFDIDLPDSPLIGQVSTTTLSFETQQQLCFIGDDIYVEIWYNDVQLSTLAGDYTVEMDTGSSFFNSVSEQQIFENADVYMNNFTPSVKMSDLLLSVFKMFNLYAEVDPNNDNNLIIETRAEYYADAPVKDWTYKLARNETITLEPLGLLTAKEYIYTYSEDSDYYNERYQEARGYAYGRRRKEIDNDFITNKNEVEVVFSPSPLVNDGNTSRIITKVYDSDIEDGRKPTDMNIRVLYYGGLKPSTPEWIFRSGSATVTTESFYPYSGHLDDPINPSIDLNFGIPLELFYSANGYTGAISYTNANLFNLYHRDYVDEITDKDSKVLTAMFRLDSFDINTLDFRNQILIDNGYWRLNKIMNYNPFKEDLTKVELIKIKDVVNFEADSFVAGTNGVTGVKGNLEPRPTTGKTTGLNGNISHIGGSVDGINNSVSSSVSGYKVIGDNNHISAGSKNVTILGNNNSVIQGASNVQIINSNNVIATESNVTYINGFKSYVIDTIDGGDGVALPRCSKSLVRLVDGGGDGVVQEVNKYNLTNLIDG